MSAATATTPARALPSIRSRLASALTAWSLLWGVAVGAAVWVAATREVDELLDDGLQATAELLAVLAAQPLPPPATVEQQGANGAAERLAWQIVGADGSVLMRSQRAPPSAWRGVPTAGFGDEPDWRLFGLALGADGRMLYAAQTRAEREEARAEVALGAVLAALAVGLLGHVWLRSRVGVELRPLQALSERLETWDLDAPDLLQSGAIGEAQRKELVPVHRALSGVAARLAARVANERAFSAHAAHALRTPLAGIDAQLAVALRDCPPPWHERVQRARSAATRLQGVVIALLGLFRSGAQAERVEFDVGELVQRMPTAGLDVSVAPALRVRGDIDLVAAALLNLLDNAQRHGARRVFVERGDGGGLRVGDDGLGVATERRERLQAALDAQDYEGTTGLGLTLADRVARAHGGRLRLLAAERGFAVELELGARQADAATGGTSSTAARRR